jgi:hypothetical protein
MEDDMDSKQNKQMAKKIEKRVVNLLTDSKTTSGHKSEMCRLIKAQSKARGDWDYLSPEIQMNITLYSNLDML